MGPQLRPLAAAFASAALASAVLIGAAAVLLGGCGPARRAPETAGIQRQFLVAVHEQDPSVQQLRSDTQLLRLGSAACAGFAAGVSFFSLADTMAVNDAQLPPFDLGAIIKAAGEDLCPRYRSRVS